MITKLSPAPSDLLDQSRPGYFRPARHNRRPALGAAPRTPLVTREVLFPGLLVSLLALTPCMKVINASLMTRFREGGARLPAPGCGLDFDPPCDCVWPIEGPLIPQPLLSQVTEYYFCVFV